MTRRRDRGWSRLEAAEAAYLERFGESAPVSPYLDHRRLPDVLFEAVERGERLTDTTLAEQLGGAPRAVLPPSAEE
jgi:hypothetical protein